MDEKEHELSTRVAKSEENEDDEKLNELSFCFVRGSDPRAATCRSKLQTGDAIKQRNK
ncbi:GD17244 [Drosophila simulans]|uniref:GD17244 n=1 Tax=Drosophila simulans TaxID=7240 RepID=B4R5I4_DROSI|nr:GD17244 [Drosophila simulans]